MHACDSQAWADVCLVRLQGNPKWSEWVSKVLQQRNTIENVFQWSCGYVAWAGMVGGSWLHMLDDFVVQLQPDRVRL